MPAVNSKKTRSKHQERTEATQAKLLSAAQDVFTRDGYANARLEQIAVEAGYTRGAIYAHYKSKEDLFLALFEQRAQMSIAEYQKVTERQTSQDDCLRELRAMLVRKASDKSWAMLVLEFKLYALRQPKLKARMQRLMCMLHSTSKTDSFPRLFGDMSAAEKKKMERRLVMMSSILTAAVLESHFRPELLSGKKLDEALAEIFELVVRK